jgi:hypothetical protein
MVDFQSDGLINHHLQSFSSCRGVFVHFASQAISSEGGNTATACREGVPIPSCLACSGGCASHPLQSPVRLTPLQRPARFAIGTGIMFFTRRPSRIYFFYFPRPCALKDAAASLNQYPKSKDVLD